MPPLHKALQANWASLNQAFQPKGSPHQELSDLQKELLALMGTYRDVYVPECSPLTEVKEVRSAYCLHVLNHVLKANSNVLSHNAQLKESKIGEDEARDQGLTRPKVTVLSHRLNFGKYRMEYGNIWGRKTIKVIHRI